MNKSELERIKSDKSYRDELRSNINLKLFFIYNIFFLSSVFLLVTGKVTIGEYAVLFAFMGLIIWMLIFSATGRWNPVVTLEEMYEDYMDGFRHLFKKSTLE